MSRLPWVKYWYGNWTSDMNVQRADLVTRGAWHETLCLLWHQGVFEHTDTIEGWARLWRCVTETAESCIVQIEQLNIGNVTKNNGLVTLLSRRLQREAISRERTKLRQQRRRGNAPVTPLCKSVTLENTPVSRGEDRGERIEERREKTEDRRQKTEKINLTNPLVSSPKTGDETKDGGSEKTKTGKGYDDYPEEFEAVWKAYPPRKLHPKAAAYGCCLKLHKNGVPWEDLLSAARNYAHARQGEDEQFTPMARTFFGPQNIWKDFVKGIPPDSQPRRELKPGAYSLDAQRTLTESDMASVRRGDIRA